jgi:hypothetical protein
MIEPKSHHSAQALTTFRHDGFPTPGIPLSRESQAVIEFVRTWWH